MNWFGFIGSLEQGLVYGIMALGVYLTFRVLDFPDLTVDGSLPLGAAVAAVAIVNGSNPYIALIYAALAGFVAGVITGVLNTKFKILHLLASILTMIALYSINIRVLNGPNVALLGQVVVMDSLAEIGISLQWAGIFVFGIFACLVAGILIWFLYTEIGQAMIASGDNPKMVSSFGINLDLIIILGVGLSNAMVAFSGALIAQNQGAADVNMGVGTIVAGLASVIVGETLLGKKNLIISLLAVILGSIVYRLAIGLALSIELGDWSINPSDLNLITAFLVVFALISPKLKRKRSLV